MNSDVSARLSAMNARVDQLLDEVLDLPTEERSALAVALLDSLEGTADASISDAWRAELRARRAELKAGTARIVSWAEARVRLGAL
jgi:putative addiction module component (TIGR02574 family)